MEAKGGSKRAKPAAPTPSKPARRGSKAAAGADAAEAAAAAQSALLKQKREAADSEYVIVRAQPAHITHTSFPLLCMQRLSPAAEAAL